MARQEASFEIEGKKYLFTQLDPRRAARVYTYLLSKFGGTISKAISGLKGNSLMEADINMGTLGEALQVLFQEIDDERTMQHIDTLLSCVLFSGQTMNLDHLNFQGSMMHLTLVLKKSLEVNFADFLDGSRGLGAKIKTLVSTIQVRQTSTGTSGDQSSQVSQP